MYLHVKVLDGSAMVRVNDGRGHFPDFLVVGSSVPTTASKGEIVPHLVLQPEKGKNGIVALAYVDEKLGWQCELVPVRWEDDKFFVGNSDSGSRVISFFDPKRPVQVYSDHEGFGPVIEVLIKDKRFASSPERTDPNTFFVSDANLLCKYLAGDLSSDDIEMAAVATRTELDTIEQLKRDLRQVWEALASSERNQVADKEKAHKEKVALDQKCESAEKLAMDLAKVLKGKWFKGKETKKLLTDPRLSWVK